MASPSIWEPSLVDDDADERRNSARSQLFALVKARGVEEPLWAWDIGLGGLQCRTRAPQWPGTFLDLAFALPGSSEELEVGAQVLSLDRFDTDHLSLGLKFCMLSPRAQRLIYRFLDGRRALWDGRGFAQPRSESPPAADERLAFMCNVNRDRLPKLGELIG